MKKSTYLLLAVALLSVHLLNAQPKYEFRGVWIATINNIDWPGGGATDPAKQKAEYIRLLNLPEKWYECHDCAGATCR